MKRILIIHSDQGQLSEWTNDLDQNEYRVLKSYNPEDGHKTAVQERPHLIFMDPGDSFDSKALAEEIRHELQKHFSYYILMTNGGKSHLDQEFHDFFDDYIEKPVDPQMLNAKIKKAFKFVKTVHLLSYKNFKYHEKIIAQRLEIKNLIHEKNNIEQLYQQINTQMKVQEQSNKEHNELLSQELEVTSKLQHEIVPKAAPEIKNYKIAYKYLLMNEVGGDFFDFYSMGESKFALLLADVSGHGIASAFITSMIKTAMGTHKNFLNSPKKIMYILNTDLMDKIHGNFVTGIYAVLDLDNPSLCYSTAGHPPIFHYRKEHHDIIEVNTRNMVLGVFENNHFQEEQIKLQKGDRLLFYTDGIYEAFDKDHNLFGFERLKELFLETHSMDIESVPDIFLERVKDFSSDNGIDDDVVLIAIEVLGE
ncbi:MAG: hypothetical protein IEMM0008_1109 [bacterium]|nr:MAG: hypothetical protein IEMM0008_1109 [bacterium]